MAVKIRERDGAWWLFIDHKGKRKAHRCGVGKAGRSCRSPRPPAWPKGAAYPEPALAAPRCLCPSFLMRAALPRARPEGRSGDIRIPLQGYKSRLTAGSIPYNPGWSASATCR
jgi:hypothetical protein